MNESKNDRWRLNRVGLINFWYYDEEEFDFIDGRMLLRGSNGSGKSVTMQSFIPLLLDGNMRPERLDPFGSKARKMENYLLEEDDDREERTGYLYMELKRQEVEQYLTLGIGLRGRRGKKLESWYFLVTDGRRVGKNFFLYKDVKSKVPFSKTELRNRLSEGGYVMESQREYMEMVNRLVFGFETMDEYEELLKLLIQLRTPKLSKDFKPSVINDILSNSLQTLSEDDLRPMSEAIENMDNIRTNIDNLKSSIRAAKSIGNVYQRYNMLVLYEKAQAFILGQNRLEQQKKEGKGIADRLKEGKSQQQKREEEYQELKCRQENLEKEIRNLEQNDAFSLAEEEKKRGAECKELQQELEKKEAKKQEKREQQIENEEKLRKIREKQEMSTDRMFRALDELAECIGDIPFDAAEFFRKEFREGYQEHFSFQTHEKELSAYQKLVKKGCEQLQREAKEDEKYQGILGELEQEKQKREDAERKVRQMEELLSEVKEEFLERLYRWKKENEIFEISDAAMAKASSVIEQYQFGEDPSKLPDCFLEERNKISDQLREQMALKRGEEKSQTEEWERLTAELKEWMEKEDPQPVREPECIRNRERLKEMGIPFDPFYKVIEFAEQLSEKQCSQLEEMLMRMGILDALIIPAQYRKQVLSMEEGVCDRYIFTDAESVKENLLQLFSIDQEKQDIVSYMNISKVLKGIGITKEATTGINFDGQYRLGILEGTITGQYHASFIGTAARERYRREQIERLTESVEEAREVLEKTREEAALLSEKLLKLSKEWEQLPSMDGVRSVANDLNQLNQRFFQLRESVSQLSARLDEQQKVLDEVRLKVQEACRGTWLTTRLDVFLEALEALGDYQKIFNELQKEYIRFEGGQGMQNTLEDKAQEIEDSLEELLYEIQRVTEKKRRAEGDLAAIRSQLALTDYQQIKESLDRCLKLRGELPLRLEACIREKERLDGELERLAKEEQAGKEKQKELEQQAVFLWKVLEKEWRLGYVAVSGLHMEETKAGAETAAEASGKEPSVSSAKTIAKEPAVSFAKTIAKELESQAATADFEELNGKVQGVFHENKGYLSEYGLTAQSIFTELKEEGGAITGGRLHIARLDICAKYRGTVIGFMDLLEKLEAELLEQENLLSDRDKELFEDILANTISKKIRVKIHASRRWVKNMNELMESMQTSSGLRLSLKWKSCKAEKEEQLDTKQLVELLEQDAQIMTQEDAGKMSKHFRSKIAEARRRMEEKGNIQSFHAIMREILDYRQWFEFQLEAQKTGEKKKELTDRVFFTFSGGEKAMAMYVPLFSAVVAKYSGARKEAPRIISLDEAFAGVDATNIKDMFRLMVEFEFDFIINSQILWGDCETVPGLSIYQLLRPQNAKYVSVIPYIWNGSCRKMADKN